ncbi:hypothetical protein DsansV1_C44g0240501 [Dioscorea sansibarensis]
MPKMMPKKGCHCYRIPTNLQKRIASHPSPWLSVYQACNRMKIIHWNKKRSYWTNTWELLDLV